MKSVVRYFLLAILLLLPSLVYTQAGASSPTGTPVAIPGVNRSFGGDLLHDQKAIWTSPFHLKGRDARWLVPLAAVTIGLIATDRHTSDLVSTNGSLQPISHGVSFAGSGYVQFGGSIGMYLAGRAAHNKRAETTGRLMTEALIDSTVVTEVLKLATQRMRPNAGDGHGHFFTSGSSFPSGHSSASWATATVLAMQYKHNPWIKYGAFAAAAAISMSRYSGRKHFLSDVVVGSAIGYGIGRYVYAEHH